MASVQNFTIKQKKSISNFKFEERVRQPSSLLARTQPAGPLSGGMINYNIKNKK